MTAIQPDGMIKVTVHSNKLEVEIENLNKLGYTVMSSKRKSDHMIKLYAQKLFFMRDEHGK